MLGYSDMSSKPQTRRLTGVWMLVLSLLLFAFTLTAVALLEAGRAQSQEKQSTSPEDLYLVSRLWAHFRAATNETEVEIPAAVERISRDAKNSSHSNSYYEEQRAVVVNAESSPPIVAQRQDEFGPPQFRMDSYETEPVYDDYGPSATSAESESVSDEGRAIQGRPFDSYYGQWQYDSKTSAPASASAAEAASSTAYNNRKLPPQSSNRSPYPAYDDVYDYPMGFQPRPRQPALSNEVVPAQTTAVSTPPVSTESTLVTILKSLKQVWDLYQALTSAWNAVAQRHEESNEQLKKERLEKQRLRQQQQQKLRPNSKKPPRFEAQRNQTKKAKGTTTTTSTTSTTIDSEESDAEATAAPVKVESPKGAKGDDATENSVRGLRQKREPEPASTDVGEGRYIKGDPLKGYYDFVITEGSYKFWAAFQVGTALLIIYSTFAAIYYSKVNPLTSDYDYQDYLGAGRSLSGGDDDFVDDSDTPTSSTSTSSTSRIMDWIPRTAHSLKFILDAIDKIPLDHDQKSEKGWSTGSGDSAISVEATGES